MTSLRAAEDPRRMVPFTSYRIVVRYDEEGPHRELRAMLRSHKVRFQGEYYMLFDSGNMLHLVPRKEIIEWEKLKPAWNL